MMSHILPRHHMNRTQAPLAATRIALRVNIDDDDDDDDRDSSSYLHRTDQQRTAAALLEATLAAPAQPSAVADRAVDLGTHGRATRARVLPAAQAETPAPQATPSPPARSRTSRTASRPTSAVDTAAAEPAAVRFEPSSRPIRYTDARREKNLALAVRNFNSGKLSVDSRQYKAILLRRTKRIGFVEYLAAIRKRGYLHESRSKHARSRVRGARGKFLDADADEAEVVAPKRKAAKPTALPTTQRRVATNSVAAAAAEAAMAIIEKAASEQSRSAPKPRAARSAKTGASVPPPPPPQLPLPSSSWPVARVPSSATHVTSQRAETSATGGRKRKYEALVAIDAQPPLVESTSMTWNAGAVSTITSTSSSSSSSLSSSSSSSLLPSSLLPSSMPLPSPPRLRAPLSVLTQSLHLSQPRLLPAHSVTNMVVRSSPMRSTAPRSSPRIASGVPLCSANASAFAASASALLPSLSSPLHGGRARYQVALPSSLQRAHQLVAAASATNGGGGGGGSGGGGGGSDGGAIGMFSPTFAVPLSYMQLPRRSFLNSDARQTSDTRPL